jgi:hypothetical protein
LANVEPQVGEIADGRAQGARPSVWLLANRPHFSFPVVAQWLLKRQGATQKLRNPLILLARWSSHVTDCKIGPGRQFSASRTCNLKGKSPEKFKVGAPCITDRPRVEARG